MHSPRRLASDAQKYAPKFEYVNTPLQYQHSASLSSMVQSAATRASLVMDLSPTARGRGVTITSVCVPTTNRWENLCAQAAGNFHGYAAHHGYGFLLFGRNLASPRPLPWAKLPALHFTLHIRSAAYAFWVDADSVFMQWQVSTELISLQP